MNQRVYIQRHIFLNLNSYEVVGVWGSHDRSCEIVREQKLYGKQKTRKEKRPIAQEMQEENGATLQKEETSSERES